MPQQNWRDAKVEDWKPFFMWVYTMGFKDGVALGLNESREDIISMFTKDDVFPGYFYHELFAGRERADAFVYDDLLSRATTPWSCYDPTPEQFYPDYVRICHEAGAPVDRTKEQFDEYKESGMTLVRLRPGENK